MNVHLMHPEADFDPGQRPPENHQDLTADLGLDLVWTTMAGGDRHLFEVARTATLCGAADPVTISYRQDVLDDFRNHRGVALRLYEIASEAEQGERRIWGTLRPNPSAILRRSVEVLALFVHHLRALRDAAEALEGAVGSAGLRRLVATLQRELDAGYFAEVDEHLEKLRFKSGVWMSAALGEGNQGVGHVLREPAERQGRWREVLHLSPPTRFSFEVHPKDEPGLEALDALKNRGLNLVANALAQSTDHILAFFTQLRAEVGFYVACLNLEEALEAVGAPLCRGEAHRIGGVPMFSARGLYDGALALRTGSRLVGNDVDADGRLLVMVTGANSGGKSTFLRSVGLAQLMLRSGMPVCARELRATPCDRLFTHFAREEDTSMESGRLDDELSRMRGVAELLTGDSIVLFNESFAGTSEWEGSEIARQVVHALVEAGVRVFFVTHLFDLSKAMYDDAGVPVLFLRAERRPDGTRSYRLLEGAPLATSYGPDIYERLGGFGVSRR